MKTVKYQGREYKVVFVNGGYGSIISSIIAVDVNVTYRILEILFINYIQDPQVKFTEIIAPGNLFDLIKGSEQHVG